MSTFIAEIKEITAPRSGTTGGKSWTLVKFSFIILESRDESLLNTEISLPVWGERAINHFTKNLKLKTGQFVQIEGEIELKSWKNHPNRVITQFKAYPKILILNDYKPLLPKANLELLAPLKTIQTTDEDPMLHQICALIDPTKRDVDVAVLRILKNHLKSNPQSINELNNQGWHSIYYTILANPSYFLELIKIPELNLDIKSPTGFSLWDHLIAANDLNKLKHLTGREIKIAWWNQPHNSKFTETPLGKTLIKDRLILPFEFKTSSDLEAISSLENLIKFFHPVLGPKALNITLTKIRVNDFFINYDLLLFLKKAFDHSFDINHLQKMLETFSDFTLINRVFGFTPILSANKYKLENFILNLTEELTDKNIKTVKMHIADTEKALKALARKSINSDAIVLSEKVNTLKKLHDQISLYLRNFERAGPNRSLELEKKFLELKELNNQVICEENKYILSIPSDTHTLCTWGFWMNNCVASYINNCLNGQCIVLGIFKDDKLIINVEIRNKSIRQIYRKANVPCSKEELKIITSFLESKKIINKKKNSGKNVSRADFDDLFFF